MLLDIGLLVGGFIAGALVFRNNAKAINAAIVQAVAAAKKV